MLWEGEVQSVVSGCWWLPVGQGHLPWATRCGHSTAYPLGCSVMPVLCFPLSQTPFSARSWPSLVPLCSVLLACFGTQEVDDFSLLLSFQEMGKILPGSRKQYNCPGTWPGVKGVPKISEERHQTSLPQLQRTYHMLGHIIRGM